MVLDRELSRDRQAEPVRDGVAQRPEHLLVLGWSRVGSQILSNLEPSLVAGSKAIVVYDPELTSTQDAPVIGDLDHLTTEVREGDPTDPSVIEAVLTTRSSTT